MKLSTAKLSLGILVLFTLFLIFFTVKYFKDNSYYEPDLSCYDGQSHKIADITCEGEVFRGSEILLLFSLFIFASVFPVGTLLFLNSLGREEKK